MNTHHPIFATLALASIALSSSNTSAQVCGTPPTNVLVRSSVCGGPVRISWTNPTGVGTVNPIVWRSPTRNFSDASLIYITGSGGQTTYADTPPTSGVNYYYWVGGNVFGCGTAPPAQSQSLPMVGPVPAGAHSLGNFPLPVAYPVCNGVILDWQAVSDATSIRVFRIADNFGAGETIATLSGSTNTYTDTAAVGGNRYIYALFFSGACGSSTFSTSLTTVRAGPWAAPTGVSRSIVVGQTTTLSVRNALDPSASPMVPFPHPSPGPATASPSPTTPASQDPAPIPSPSATPAPTTPEPTKSPSSAPATEQAPSSPWSSASPRPAGPIMTRTAASP